MKKLILALVGFVLPSSAFAWTPQMQFQITPHTAQVQVYNFTAFPALCQGYVYGQVQTGAVVNSWFSAYIPAGTFAYSYIYATYPYYFVNAWARINCR